MDAKEFVACLGKKDTSPEVVRLLKQLGIQKKLRVPRGDIEARVDLAQHGLSLIFEPRESKSSELTFVAAQFFSDAEKGFATFSGTLPKGLRFSDTQATVRKKLGKPADTTKAPRADIWRTASLQTSVEYSGKAGAISMVACELPEDE